MTTSSIENPALSINPSELEDREKAHPAYEAVNWNTIDPFMLDIWNKLISQFWVPEKIPVSNDIKTWNTLTDNEKRLVLRVFTGLTMLDTVQGRFGATSIKRDATSLHEEAILDNIAFMEQVHAKSYSNIFSTLSNTEDINASFRWSEENEFLRKKVDVVMAQYRNNSNDPVDQIKKKIVSVLLESFLFYSGFYLPFHMSGHAKLTNVADLIKLILRDEAIHGYFLGYLAQRSLEKLDEDTQMEIKSWTYDLLQELYENEIRYTQDLYDELGLTEEVKIFLRYNGNRALANLGFDPLFPAEEVNPMILAQMDLTQETHDFFSGAGSSYVIAAKADQQLDEEDWEF